MTAPRERRTVLTAVERARVAHLVADHGARYYGRIGGLTFSRSDAVRYCTEGWVIKALPDIDPNVLWDLVGELLTDDILKAGALSDARVAANVAARESAAQVYEAAAREAFEAGRWADALAAIDAAELECPQRPGFRSWDDLRRFVRNAAERAGVDLGGA